jgi:hypothetical protein
MFGVIGLLNLLTADADARWVGWALLGVAAAFIIGGQLVAWNNRRKLFTRLQAGTQTAEPD